VVIECRRAEDAESLHDGEARPVDDREVLIREGLADREGALEVGYPHGFDRRSTATDPLPVALSGVAAEARRQQEPGLHENMVARYESFAGIENPLRPCVVAVVGIHSCVEDRRIDEQRQLAASMASPT